MPLRSPLAKARGLGSARNGTETFIAQRLTAIALIPLLVWFIIAIVSLADTGFSYQLVVDWIRTPHITVFLTLTVIILFYHTYIGLREILEDYIPNHMVRTISIIIMEFFILTITIASVLSILRVALGGQ